MTPGWTDEGFDDPVTTTVSGWAVVPYKRPDWFLPTGNEKMTREAAEAEACRLNTKAEREGWRLRYRPVWYQYAITEEG